MDARSAYDHNSGTSMLLKGSKKEKLSDRQPLTLPVTNSEASGNAMAMSVAVEVNSRQIALDKRAEEHALVRKAQEGDRLAFEELVRRYDREVLRLALNLVHRPEDARDIYQESFLKVYRNLHRFRFECSFYTWLYRITTNVALDFLRRRTSHKEDQAPVLPDESEYSTRDFFDRQPQVSAAANPEEAYSGKSWARRFRKL